MVRGKWLPRSKSIGYGKSYNLLRKKKGRVALEDKIDFVEITFDSNFLFRQNIILYIWGRTVSNNVWPEKDKGPVVRKPINLIQN